MNGTHCEQAIGKLVYNSHQDIVASDRTWQFFFHHTRFLYCTSSVFFLVSHYFKDWHQIIFTKMEDTVIEEVKVKIDHEERPDTLRK